MLLFSTVPVQQTLFRNWRKRRSDNDLESPKVVLPAFWKSVLWLRPNSILKTTKSGNESATDRSFQRLTMLLWTGTKEWEQEICQFPAHCCRPLHEKLLNSSWPWDLLQAMDGFALLRFETTSRGKRWPEKQRQMILPRQRSGLKMSCRFVLGTHWKIFLTLTKRVCSSKHYQFGLSSDAAKKPKEGSFQKTASGEQPAKHVQFFIVVSFWLIFPLKCVFVWDYCWNVVIFSVLVGASATGEKLPLLAIGKSKRPRCFGGKRSPKTIPIEWRSNSKAWMTSAIFCGWLRSLNDNMKRQKRKILLLLDNASCHTHLKLSNVRLVFFPPNFTARI